MPKLILRCNYLKNSPPAHLANYINYIGTREGVEKVGSTTSSLPATDRQKSLIEDILAKIPDANWMHEYHDYIQRPTRENASEFITQALENNLDIIAKKKNYMDYLANRPGVEIIGTHGLFSNEGEPVVLSRVAEEVANHPGVIWTNVISLRREDAERLGYDSAAQWQALLRSRVQLLCENYKIDSRNLKWYAAFHNESHHPHVHLVVYSSDPSEGYLTAKGIDAMRSAYAHDIFRQEFLSMLYLQGKGVEQDEETAYSLLFRSYSKGNPYAAYELGKLYETGCGTEKNQEKSENCYRAAFLGFLNLEKRSKDDTLWYRIGCMYLHGIGTEADETKAEHYLTKASDYGNTHASYQLARLYIRQESQKLSGESGTAPDYAKIAKAVKWLEESAAQENPFADYAIGRLYREGTLVAEDMEKAVFHLKRAADARNSYAQYQLGKIYLEEDTKNIPAAIQYLTLAAKQKNQFAAYRLGKLYLAGEELPKNTELALHYLKMAADTGNQYAQYALGKVYLIGKDVQQDKELAYDYFLKSAEQGNIYAAYFLEHWNDMPHPDLFLMATRLMRHLEHIIEENVAGRKSGGRRQGIDRKLARKIRQKKIAQGHAVDDHENMVQTQ